MRESLFKAKRVDNGEWVEGYYVYYGWTGKQRHYIVPSYASDLCAFEVNPETICQYTGLTDKNGRKIFEGDIIEFLDSKAVVEWDDKNARFLGFTLEGERKIVYVGREPKVQIVGNIFDNPDLLKGGDNP